MIDREKVIKAILIDADMPTCCADCFALDESGDYPFCRISHDQRGYTFDVRQNRMPSCPISGPVVYRKGCKYNELNGCNVLCDLFYGTHYPHGFCDQGELRDGV